VFQNVESVAALPFEGLTFLTAKSSALGGRGDITLFVPEQARASRNVPLVLLLHGAFGSHWHWAISGGAHRTAQRLMARGRIPPFVLAMPSDGLWGDGTGYMAHHGHDFEKWIVEDATNAVRAAVPCLSAKSPLFLSGMSMGGFGALRIGAKHPGFCRGISVHSSVTHFKQLLAFVDEDAASFGPLPEDCSVLETILRHRQTLPPIRFDCGLSDILIKQNRQLHRELETSGIAHYYEEFSGGHDWPYWTAHVEESFMFFADILSPKKHP
jgi:enterochelin esterase-like enzyme